MSEAITMDCAETQQAIEEIKQFAKRWNELFAVTKFDEMKDLAIEDVAIANAAVATNPSA